MRVRLFTTFYIQIIDYLIDQERVLGPSKNRLISFQFVRYLWIIWCLLVTWSSFWIINDIYAKTQILWCNKHNADILCARLSGPRFIVVGLWRAYLLHCPAFYTEFSYFLALTALVRFCSAPADACIQVLMDKCQISLFSSQSEDNKTNLNY